MGKLRKQRSRHAIPANSTASGPAPPAISQPAAPTVSAATATATTASPIALKTSRPSAPMVTSSNHDDFSGRGSPVPAPSIDFNVGSPSSGSNIGEMSGAKGRPKSVVSKQSSSSLRSSDKEHHAPAPPHTTTDTESILSNSEPPTGMTASTSASALSLLRERLSEDEAARKRQHDEEAKEAAAPRKLHKKRGPSEANSPPSGIAEETASVLEGATVVGEEDEESKKVTQIDQSQQTPTPLASPELAAQPQLKQQQPASTLTEVHPVKSSWIPTLAIPRPSAVVSYATATTRSAASTAFKIAALPVTVPLSLARKVPIIRVIVPASKKSSPPPADGENSPRGHDVDQAAAQAKAKAPQAKEGAAGVAWKTAELSLGLGIAAVLVSAAGADYAFKRVTGWRRKQDVPAGIIH